MAAYVPSTAKPQNVEATLDRALTHKTVLLDNGKKCHMGIDKCRLSHSRKGSENERTKRILPLASLCAEDLRLSRRAGVHNQTS